MSEDSGTLARAVDGYVKLLENQSPIYSTSHYYLRGMYDSFGKERVDQALDLYFETQKEQAQ